MARSREPRYWPALLDLLASTLMVFLLVTYVQDVLSLEELEGLLIRQQQAAFATLFEQELTEEIVAGSVSLERRQNAVVITFSDRVLFDSGDYRLSAEGRSLLERCRALLAQANDVGFELVQVEGHTDSLPVRRSSYPANNWQLSAARAIRVVELLVEDGALDPRSLSANGYADTRPVADNGTDAGRALNRRIEMRIFFAGGRSMPTQGEAG